MFKVFYSSRSTILEARGDVADAEIPAFGAVIGKFSPLTVGHRAMLNQLIAECSKRDITPVICIVDAGTNNQDRLLTAEEREAAIKNEYNAKADVVIVKNAFQALVNIKETGGALELIVCGSDRADQYTELTSVIFNSEFQPTPTDVVVLGRDPDADSDDSVTTASSSRARQLARDGNLQEFNTVVGLPQQQSSALFNLLRDRMGITNG